MRNSSSSEAITGACRGSASEIALVHQSLHPDTKSPHGPCLPSSAATQQDGGSRAQEDRLAVSDKGDSNHKQHLRRVRAVNVDSYKQHNQPLAVSGPPACIPSHTKSPNGHLLLPYYLPLGKGCRCWEVEEHTPKGNWASLDLKLIASALVT